MWLLLTLPILAGELLPSKPSYPVASPMNAGNEKGHNSSGVRLDLVNVKDMGAKGNGKIASPIISLAAGSTTLKVSTPLFTLDDIGKIIIIAGAGIAPKIGPLETISLKSSGTGYTSVPTVAITDATASGSGAAASVLMSLQSATLVSGGRGGLAGQYDILVGIDGTGTPAKLNVTITDGSVTAINSVTASGLLSALGTLSAAPGYGANFTTAPTFNLAYGVAAIQMNALGKDYMIGKTAATLIGGSPQREAVLERPTIGGPIPPLKTMIAAYASSTQVTLAVAASTEKANVATQLLWATNDTSSFQNAISFGAGILIPGGIYWIDHTLGLGAQPLTIRGEGSNNSIIAFDNGTSTIQDRGDWTPLFERLEGSPSSLNGTFQVADVQIRGLLDFGQVNAGGPALEMNYFSAIDFDHVKFYQIPWMAMQLEGARAFTVTNSVFDSVMRDMARCRSCFSTRIIGNQFIHGDDDAVALHQAYYVKGPGTIREAIVVEGNDLEDVQGIHLIGARDAIVRANTFRRVRFYAVSMQWSIDEGIEQMRSITIADNKADDILTRYPYIPASCVYCILAMPPAGAAGVTSFLPGGNAFPSSYFGKPWDYDLNNVVPPLAAPAAAMRGIDISNNSYMRTLPAVASFSAWGFGKTLTNVGLQDPTVPDTALRPTSGISVSVNTSDIMIHHNSIANTRRGIVAKDTVATPSQASLSVDFNHIYDAWEYGFYALGSGTLSSLNFIGNIVDVDPYMISPGREGGHGGWASGYTASRCFASNYNAVVIMSNNTFSDCYTVQTAASWIISNNIIRGNPNSAITDQLIYSPDNYGVGVYPPNVSNQFFVEPVLVDPKVNPPRSLGTIYAVHVLTSSAAPTSGYHVQGDIVAATDPRKCSCYGWLALTSGTTWRAGIDFKTMSLY